MIQYRWPFLVLAILLAACFQMEDSGTTGSGGDTGVGTTDGTILPPIGGQGATSVQWTFVGPDIIENIFLRDLGLNSTHPSVRGVRADAVTLGGPDYVTHKPANLTPAPDKAYKSVYHFMQACIDGLKVSAVAASLFPNGTTSWNASSFNGIYKKFLGRSPATAEVQALLTLTGAVTDPAKRAPAVCVVVLNSIEALGRN